MHCATASATVQSSLGGTACTWQVSLCALRTHDPLPAYQPAILPPAFVLPFLPSFPASMAGEQRKEDEGGADHSGSNQGIVGVKRTPAANSEVAQLNRELAELDASGKLDGFGKFLYGIVLKQVTPVTPPERESSLVSREARYVLGPPIWIRKMKWETSSTFLLLTQFFFLFAQMDLRDDARRVMGASCAAFPLNWCAWLELASLSHSYQQVPRPLAIEHVQLILLLAC